MQPQSKANIATAASTPRNELQNFRELSKLPSIEIDGTGEKV